jgi:alpha-galactosidase
MNIIWNKTSGHFHLYNDRISYIIGVAINGELTNLYFGKKIHEKDDFSYITFRMGMPNIVVDADTESYSMELNCQEYPSFGTTDFGTPAFEIETENGSRVSSFVYKSHTINKGKKGINGLPATYADADEAMTLEILLEDEAASMTLTLSYTIFDKYPVIARHAEFAYTGSSKVRITRALSCCLDLPDQVS